MKTFYCCRAIKHLGNAIPAANTWVPSNLAGNGPLAQDLSPYFLTTSNLLQIYLFLIFLPDYIFIMHLFNKISAYCKKDFFKWSTFAATDSKSMAIVILEGNACGLIIRSGRIPVTPEKGMSISGHNWEQTPFWPCRLLNLSPIIGFLGCRNRMFTCSKKK